MPRVRGSSRRIMTLRFRPAYIRVINRRYSSTAVISSALQKQRPAQPQLRTSRPQKTKINRQASTLSGLDTVAPYQNLGRTGRRWHDAADALTYALRGADTSRLRECGRGRLRRHAEGASACAQGTVGCDDSLHRTWVEARRGGTRVCFGDALQVRVDAAIRFIRTWTGPAGWHRTAASTCAPGRR